MFRRDKLLMPFEVAPSRSVSPLDITPPIVIRELSPLKMTPLPQSPFIREPEGSLSPLDMSPVTAGSRLLEPDLTHLRSSFIRESEGFLSPLDVSPVTAGSRLLEPDPTHLRSSFSCESDGSLSPLDMSPVAAGSWLLQPDLTLQASQLILIPGHGATHRKEGSLNITPPPNHHDYPSRQASLITDLQLDTTPRHGRAAYHDISHHSRDDSPLQMTPPGQTDSLRTMTDENLFPFENLPSLDLSTPLRRSLLPLTPSPASVAAFENMKLLRSWMKHKYQHVWLADHDGRCPLNPEEATLVSSQPMSEATQFRVRRLCRFTPHF